MTGNEIKLLYPPDNDFPGPPSWLLEPFVLDAECTLLEGREGIGKGLLCARLAVGVASGELGPEPRTVLWASFEDDPMRTVYPRLLAAGWRPDEHEKILFFDATEHVTLPGCHDELVATIETHNPGLLIIDPIKSMMGPVPGMRISPNDDAYVRHIFEPICRLAQRLRIPIVVLGHHRKARGEGDDRDLTLGSVAWRAVPRAVVQMRIEGTGAEGRGAICMSKCNIAPTGAMRGYRILPKVVTIQGQEVSTACLEVGGALEQTTLGEWSKSMAADDEQGIEVAEGELSPNALRVQEKAKESIADGESFWTQRQLMDDFELKQHEAKTVVRELRAAGHLEQHGGGPLKWRTEPLRGR